MSLPNAPFSAILPLSCEEEAGETAGFGAPATRAPACRESELQTRKPECIHRRLGRVGVGGLRIVLEISEAEVREPLGADGLGETERQAVVVNVGTAVQTAGAKSLSAERSEAALSGQREIIEAEAPEHLVVVGSAVVDAGVKRFLIERT